MGKTELLFFVIVIPGGWVVQSEGQLYGPFFDYSDAFREALDEAQAAAAYGFASAVHTQPCAGGPFRRQWACEQEPPHSCEANSNEESGALSAEASS